MLDKKLKGFSQGVEAVCRGEKEVFFTDRELLYWEVLQILADHQIRHRGVVRELSGELPRRWYRVFVKRKDFSDALKWIQHKDVS